MKDSGTQASRKTRIRRVNKTWKSEWFIKSTQTINWIHCSSHSERMVMLFSKNPPYPGLTIYHKWKISSSLLVTFPLSLRCDVEFALELGFFRAREGSCLLQKGDSVCCRNFKRKLRSFSWIQIGRDEFQLRISPKNDRVLSQQWHSKEAFRFEQARSQKWKTNQNFRN